MAIVNMLRSPTTSAQQPEEACVVDSVCAAPLSLSTISLSSAAPASSELHLTSQTAHNASLPPPPPVNSPEKAPPDRGGDNSSTTSMQQQRAADDLLGCFTPLWSRLWPSMLSFNWSAVQKEHTVSSDVDNYEIPIDSIDVQWDANYIGGGNQSSVFRAKYDGKWIALKKLNRTTEVDIKRLCALEHGNVIKTLGICAKENFPCIVMEYCDKGSLFDYLRRSPHISKQMFLDCCTQLADGMAYLHSLKIVHRDLKSPNILLDSHDVLKICDFGSLYTWEQRINSQNHNPQGMASVVMSVCGTSQWMSPEMLTNRPCNERVDVWSYGVVLWELLTGLVPYEKIPPTAVFFLVGSGNIQLHVPKTTPYAVSLLLTLCWARNPRNRPSFKTILKDLLSNVRAELAEVRDEGWLYRREQWRKEIAERDAKLHDTGMDYIGEKQKEQELVKKRMHELRHAQEIRQMYADKLLRVNEMHKDMCLFMEEINERKRETDRTAEALSERLAHDRHWHQLLHEWHVALRDLDANTTGGKNSQLQALNAGQGSHNAELEHLILQAEAAKQAAMCAQNGESNAGLDEHHAKIMVGHQPSNITRQRHTRLGPKNAPGRPAVLRMTYFDYDGDSTRMVGLRQKVTTTTAHRDYDQSSSSCMAIRKSVCSRSAYSSASSSPFNSSSSSCGSDDEAEEDHQMGGNNNGEARKAHRKHKRAEAKVDKHRDQIAPISCPSECSGVFSRTSSCRLSADFTPAKAISRDDSAISSIVPFSPSERSLQSLSNNNSPASPAICINCHQALHLREQFLRNTAARVSGLSADSGVCPEESNGNNNVGALTTCCLTPNSCSCPTTRRRKQRWSDESRKKQQQQRSQQSATATPFSRNSPMRTPSRQRRAKPDNRSEDGLSHCMSNNNNSNNSDTHSHSTTISGSSVLTLVGHERTDEKPMPHPKLGQLMRLEFEQQQQHHSFSSPELCQLNAARQMKEEQNDGTSVCATQLCPINEMTDSQLTERALEAEKAIAATMMESLSSTMVSSLERSLELSMAHSDGLSDKETKLKEARTTFKLTHRRTASNPINLSRPQKLPPEPENESGSTSSEEGSVEHNSASSNKEVHV